MRLTIHGLDYSCALDGLHPITIERKLNELSVCMFWLSLPSDGSIPEPARNQEVAATGDDGTLYFTGYIATTPIPQYAGVGVEGASYRLAIYALSDEMLLDQLALPPGNGIAGMAAGALMTNLITSSGSSAISAQGLSLTAPVSRPSGEAGAPWSRIAGQIANEARATYRALAGSLSLAQIPAVVHALSATDGSRALSGLVLKQDTNRTFVNDVTVCGEHEPTAYVVEYFNGDGVTTQFELGEIPFFLAGSCTQIIRELFDESVIDGRAWCQPGSAGHFSLGANGIVLNGGSGVDGDTMLSWINPVEMGGTLLLEASGVSLSSGSSGTLAGFYSGVDTQSGCTAGFQVATQPGSGAVSVQPLILGSPAGLTYSIDPTKQYTLRSRLNCPEVERQLSVYRSCGDEGSIAFGGQSIDAPARIRMEIQETVNGVAGVPVALYDGSIVSLPGACSVVAASSLNLLGTMRSLTLTNIGSGWVVSTPAAGGSYSRRIGTLAQGGECHLDRLGKLIFETGCAPLAGERIAVSYRVTGRAVGRAVDTASQQKLAQAGLPDVATWTGSVLSPQARSSADCRNAAMALVQASSSASALWSGTYKGVRWSFSSDVWPGDALLLNAESMNISTQMVIRSVQVSYAGTYPELIGYAISFANDWAEDLAIRTSKAVPEDAWLPAPFSPTVLPNLAGITVTSLSGTSISIDTGMAAPDGGGFEIRRRDYVFMPGEDADLVMRGTQRSLTFSRQSANDRFFIRAYDGSTPPNYSEFSAALFITSPLGASAAKQLAARCRWRLADADE